jgi:beta-lactamase superfamily II metal-dependent hydrolase
MTVHFLDVGQADSIFIDFGSYEILVDGGNNDDGPFVADYIRPYVDGDLDLMVGTHAHEDHIGGLDNVINAYQVDRIVYSDETSSTVSFQNFYNAAAYEQSCTFTGDSDLTFDMGEGAEFKILEMGDGYAEPNENSVVSMIDYNDVEVLLMGDLESTVEKTNLSRFSDIDVLKVGHHGSRTATSQAFLDVVRPEVSVISAGLDNKYSLPNADIITRLLSMNSAVYGTFRSGNIVMTTDGFSYGFNTNVRLTAGDSGALSTVSPGIQTQKSNTVSESEAVFIGNASTMKFHTLDCSAGSKIADRNVIYFKTREDAVNQGYVPCKLCNP